MSIRRRIAIFASRDLAATMQHLQQLINHPNTPYQEAEAARRALQRIQDHQEAPTKTWEYHTRPRPGRFGSSNAPQSAGAINYYPNIKEFHVVQNGHTTGKFKEFGLAHEHMSKAGYVRK